MIDNRKPVKENLIRTVEHVYSDPDDRWMYIEYDINRKVIGLNFMQGSDSTREYNDFKAQWCVNDANLTRFYDTMLYTFPVEKQSSSPLDFINKCMWAYFSANDKTWGK